jgi:tyrosine-protein phosphatase SIW14
MTRLTLLLTLVAVTLVVALPLLYADGRGKAFRNLRVVEEGKVYRSGQMTPAGFERVCQEKGIRTVIKLRDPSDAKDQKTDAAEEVFCKAKGIRLVRLQTQDWEEDASGNVPMEANLREFEGLIDEKKDGEYTYGRPVLIHCFAGIHRTGAHVAVYRMKYHGWSNAEAVAELQSCGKPSTTYVGNLIPFMLKYRPTSTVADGGLKP